jgi:hypothetical protein
MTDYCISCKHCSTHIKTTYWCKQNCVMRQPTDTCCWNTKRYPSKFEPQIPIPEKPAQCLCETCRMTVEQCRGQQLRQYNPQPPCPKYKVWQYCMVAVEMRSNILMEVVQKVRHLIREEGYDCGEAERILVFLKEMK